MLLWAACSAAWLYSLRNFYLDLAWNCCFNLHLLSLILTPYTNAESLAPFSWWFPLKFRGLLLCPPQSCPSSRLNQPWTLSLKGRKSAPNLTILVASPILSPVYQCFSCTEKPKIGGSMLMLSYRCWIEGFNTSLSWLAMLLQPMMQQVSIGARDNKTRDNDSDETKIFTACVVLISGENFNFTIHQVPNYY